MLAQFKLDGMKMPAGFELHGTNIGSLCDLR
jgi:hypothetical protein